MSDNHQPLISTRAGQLLSGKISYDVQPTVFLTSALLILCFALLGALFTDAMSAAADGVQAFIVSHLGWFYVLAVFGLLPFVLWLMFSRAGSVRLGPDDSRPEFSTLSWFAMLFSAGMGIGLLFYGVAEPLSHFASPPQGEGGTVEAARRAMRLTFFHWGLHAWAIYVVVGLAIAYFSFRRGLPMTLRSALFPLLGERVRGPIGSFVDIAAVVGTLFGVATSLGLGVLQINAGLNHVFQLPQTLPVQVGLIAAITALATVSVVTGVKRGIRRLSELNVLLAALLLLFVLAAGPTLFLLRGLLQHLGDYFVHLAATPLWSDAFGDAKWQGSWTIFYWAWWIAWSPFVGMFIARVSRGRTVREFVVGVLLAPVAVTFLWLTVFGDTALHVELFGAGGLQALVRENLPAALFAMLESLPLAGLTSLLATLVVVLFFVTSSDSGSLVIDIITAGGNPDPPRAQRVFWAVLEGVVAAVLLAAGGLVALQTAAITTALPFTLVIIAICVCLVKALRAERDGEHE